MLMRWLMQPVPPMHSVDPGSKVRSATVRGQKQIGNVRMVEEATPATASSNALFRFPSHYRFDFYLKHSESIIHVQEQTQRLVLCKCQRRILAEFLIFPFRLSSPYYTGGSAIQHMNSGYLSARANTAYPVIGARHNSPRALHLEVRHC
jgi:hypothetical protein